MTADVSDPGLDSEAEAQLNYHKVVEAQKLHSRQVGAPGVGAVGSGTVLAAAGASAPESRAENAGRASKDEIRFPSHQLSASSQVDANGRIGEDPWGDDEDEYAVAGFTPTRDADGRRDRATGMALRGSGTRGANGRDLVNRPIGSPLGGAPVATVGGVGGTAGVGGAGPIGGLASTGALPTGQAAVGLPINVLQSQSASTAVSTAAYAPAGVPGIGVSAANAGLLREDPVTTLEALRLIGYDPSHSTQHFDSDARLLPGDELVDTDGDGIPDTPRSLVKNQTGDRANKIATGPAGALKGAVGQAGAVSGSSGINTHASTGGRPGSVLSTPGSVVGIGVTGISTAAAPPATVPAVAAPTATNAAFTAPTVTVSAAASSATSPSVTQGGSSSGPISGTLIGPQAGANGGNGAGGTGIGFSQSTPAVVTTGGSDFSVSPADLSRAAKRWHELSDQAEPVITSLKALPTGQRMFGIISEPAASYDKAVRESVEAVGAATEVSALIGTGVDLSKARYEDYEAAAAVDAQGKVNE